MLNIIHFSQDFTTGKKQLGAFGRILNLANDGNNHFIFTLGVDGQKIFSENRLSENCLVVEVPFSFSQIGFIRKQLAVKSVSFLIKNYIQEQNIQVDLLFGHSQLINFLILKGIGLDKPIIWEMNAVWGAIQNKGFKNKLIGFFLKRLEYKIIESANGIIFHTNSSLEWVNKTYKTKKLTSKSIVVTNAFDFPTNKTENQEQKTNLKYKILINGLFDDLNGGGFLFDFFSKHKCPQIEFYFYGYGPWFSKLIMFNERDNVFVKDAIPRLKMLELYNEFDFILIPRIKDIQAELFIPSKLIEAMGYGLVPIVSNVNGMTEVVKGTEGFVFEPGYGDSLNKILENVSEMPRENWGKLSKASKELINERYSWAENHLKLSDFYKLITRNADNPSN